MHPQPLPWSIRPIIHVPSLGLLPALDKDFWQLPIELLPLLEDDIQGSLGALLGGQIRHIATSQFGL